MVRLMSYVMYQTKSDIKFFVCIFVIVAVLTMITSMLGGGGGGEGSLGPKSYLLLIWTFFGLVEQLLINLQLNGYSVIKYKLFFQSTLKSLVYFLRYCGSVYCITLFYSRIGFCNKKIVGYRQSLGACLVSFTFSRGQKGVASPPPPKKKYLTPPPPRNGVIGLR